MNPFSFRPQLEQLDGRCLPSANPLPALGGAALGSPATAALASAPEQQGVPIHLSTHITSDGALGLTLSGVGGQLGKLTGQGGLDELIIDPDAGRGAIRGTATLTAANGDQLFAVFSASWDLTTGVGEVTVTFTGGTGRFADASGSATEVCHVTGDPSSPSTFECSSQGTGTLVLDHSR